MGMHVAITVQCDRCPTIEPLEAKLANADKVARARGRTIVETHCLLEPLYLCPECTRKRCKACNGRGWGYDGSGDPAPVTCPTCGGSGVDPRHGD
jgi:hypothetical protein